MRQIGVWSLHSRDQSAHRRQNSLEVNSVDLAYQAVWLSEIQNAALTLRPEHTHNFPQSRVVVGQVAKAESGSQEIELRICDRQTESVRFYPSSGGSGCSCAGTPP